jgi:hypothetical protein
LDGIRDSTCGTSGFSLELDRFELTFIVFFSSDFFGEFFDFFSEIFESLFEALFDIFLPFLTVIFVMVVTSIVDLIGLMQDTVWSDDGFDSRLDMSLEIW